MQHDQPDTVHRSHRLLANFPLASSTPTSHVSSHLHSMTVGAPDPYAYQRAQYAQELAHLSSYQGHQNNVGGYWQAAQDNASRYMALQHSYEYHNHWPSLPPPTAYTHNNFSHSLFYPQNPPAPYPTPPPPPGIAYTSSSLAFALGRPTPEQSPAFFNDFLEKKTSDLNLNPPPIDQQQQLTPRKRKPQPQLESPSKKRQTTPRPRPRRNSQVFVDIPPVPWITPSSSKSPSVAHDRGTSPDLASRESESPTRVVKESARKTGDRDERPPLEKLRSLLDDLFEAEDSLSPETDITELSTDFFSPNSTSGSQPHLAISQIRKLVKSVTHVGQSSRSRPTSGPTQAKGHRLARIDTPILGRILKVLDRSVKAAEDLNPFGDSITGAATTTKVVAAPAPSPVKKASKGGKAIKLEDLEPVVTIELSEEAHIALDRALDVANEGILAANCCLAILSGDRLPKELYSEELIASILTLVKNLLTNIIYPVAENASSDTLHHLTRNSPSSTPCIQHHRRVLGEMHQAILALIPRLVSLISSSNLSMSDSIIIQAVYIAIGPFFILEPPESKKDDVVIQTFGKSAMRGLRLEALSLIRSIFAHHQEQRSWIIEEILSSLIKLSDTKQKAGQFKLRDGRSIRTVSALLLQLIQTSAHDVRMQAAKINKRRQHNNTLQRQDSTASAEEAGADELDFEELTLYANGLESATNAAKAVVLFLNARSGKGKTTKNANEVEYRAIFDALISDILLVLHWPEWPAASLLLNIASKFLVSSLDDVGVTTTDNNATRSTALEHLGAIAARIRAVRLSKPESSKLSLKTLDDIAARKDVQGLNKLMDSHREVWRHLDKQASEDQALNSAREFSAVNLGHELALALKAANDSSDPFCCALRSAIQTLWTRCDGDVFDTSSQEDSNRIDLLARDLGGIHVLSNSFQAILAVVLRSLEAPVIFMRTKALKALSQIVGSDQSVLNAPNVRSAIDSRLLDNSPAVRDAAVELVGKYVLEYSDVAESYWEKIADRIADTAVSVRKRVIKLLKSFYIAMDDYRRRVDIGTRLVLRTMDEDTGVRDLAIKTAQELWFEDETQVMRPQISIPDDGKLVEKVSVIMGVCANFKDRHSPLEDLLQSVVSNVNSSSSLFTGICQILVDGLVDACDFPGFTVANCIRTIYLFVSAQPTALSAPNASTLLPYLKTTTTVEDQNVVDYLLKIFRVTVPHLPKTSAKLGQELQQTLQPMIIKPANSGGVQTLQEVVALLCVVVKHLTHEFGRLVGLFKSCDARLQKWVNKPPRTQLAGADSRTVSILILIVSLLAENCDFEAIRRLNSTQATDLNSITKNTIIDHVYTTLLRLHNHYEEEALKSRILQCLGFLFKAQPSLMTLESSAVIMDEVFSSSEDSARVRLLKIIQDFLSAEADKNAALLKATSNVQPGEVNMEQLVGNTEEFADSGVASAIIQRYLNHVLKAALSKNPQLQGAAVEILTYTVKQGLAHPLQSFPVVVALETSDNEALSARAATLHGLLHTKHASLLNSRYIDCAKASFEYQVSVQPNNNWKGFRTKPSLVALLQRWYSLVREKRPARLEFLRSLSKSFSVDLSLKSSQSDINFARYMAENFATLEYKTQEEVLTIIKHLTSILSTTGMQVMHLMSPSDLLSQLHNDSMVLEHQVQEAGHNSLSIQVARTSIIIGVIAILKSYLQGLYGLSDEKCSRFQLGKKSAIGDKSAQRRHGNVITWERMPYAEYGIKDDDLERLKAKFIELWNEDGVVADADEDPIPSG